MIFVSAFSGIEAASSAWHPLGWKAAALIEFDAFPSAVLAHHYPDTPNLGDITQVTEDQIKALGHVDVFVFGSPCQDLSVAGKRKGLDGERSGLFFDAMRLVRWMRQHCGLRWAVWENVPGAFSSNEGRDFAAVVAALGGFDSVDVPPKGWGTEGAAAGPEALVEWSTLDAQWFGVAQRRRRCFAVADFGAWAGRPPVLLEPDRLRGDTAPSRETGQIAPTIPARSLGGGGLGTDFDCDGGLVRVTVMAHGQGGAEVRDDGGAPCLTCNHEAPIAVMPTTAHTLRGEGFDASEDGTGRGTPLVPDIRYAYYSHDYANDRITDPAGVNPALTANASASGNLNVLAPTIGFDCKSSGQNGTTHCIGTGSSGRAATVAVAVALRGREGGSTAELGDEVQNCLRASSGGGDKPHVLAPVVGWDNDLNASVEQMGALLKGGDGGRHEGVMLPTMQVRRLTPRECERLQGFQDDYTLIPTTMVTHRKGCEFFGTKEVVAHGTDRLACGCKAKHKPADQCPDGPRYKALGNSMAVPVMRWIGQRIEFAHLYF